MGYLRYGLNFRGYFPLKYALKYGTNVPPSVRILKISHFLILRRWSNSPRFPSLPSTAPPLVVELIWGSCGRISTLGDLGAWWGCFGSLGPDPCLDCLDFDGFWWILMGISVHIVLFLARIILPFGIDYASRHPWLSNPSRKIISTTIVRMNIITIMCHNHP